MIRVAVLHAYSSDNLGDGLLVDAALNHINTVFGEAVDVTLFASRPESFEDRHCRLVCTKPRNVREFRDYIRALGDLDSFDLLLGVGGGYLRFGTLSEGLKTAIIHGPQLVAASRHGSKAVYLPQSIGPLPRHGSALLRRPLAKMCRVFVRDDRTAAELDSLANVRRVPDMAIWADSQVQDRADLPEVDPVVVLSTRHLNGVLPKPVKELAAGLGVFDGYVQSQVGRNDDSAAVRELSPRCTLAADALLNPCGSRRVVVAMRLHAALMAINAGHYVIHLAYERKGFGAFDDLGIVDYVHPVKLFDPVAVLAQAQSLLADEDERRRYDDAVRQHRYGSVVRAREVETDSLRIAGTAS